VKDGDELSVGRVKLKILETPGHTPEGISIIVESENEPRRILTGDTLFIGDVGRPDLVGSKGQPPRRWRRCYSTVCTAKF
jgi:glyoxylase-like metal-dependent hydrolase (beta-lactamase superfamily II)